MKNYLTTDAVAARLGVCTRQIRYLCTRGQLDYQKVGSAFVIDPASVAAYERAIAKAAAGGNRRGRPKGSSKYS